MLPTMDLIIVLRDTFADSKQVNLSVFSGSLISASHLFAGFKSDLDTLVKEMTLFGSSLEIRIVLQSSY